MDSQFNQIPTQPEVSKKNSGVAIAALVCGIVGFIINPAYLVSIAAIVLGIVGLCQKNYSKGMAVTGLILGCVSLVVGFILDLILSVFTMGLSFCI